MGASELHREIAIKATKFIMRLHSCNLGAFEFTGGWNGGEYVDGVAINSDAVYVIEAKVSRADFLADRKKPHRADPAYGLGQYRYYACPEGMIKPEELPERWGLIYINSRGHCSMPVGYGGYKWDNTKSPAVIKRYGSWERVLKPADQWNPSTRVVHEHSVDGVDSRKYFRFTGNPNVERSYLYALAKRYKERKFMNNIL